MFNEIEAKRKLGYPLAIIAATIGFSDNIKHARTLQIKPSEFGRYSKKTVDLSMCYAGFAQNFSVSQAVGAGRAAFLSCAFDVVTD